MADKVIIEYDAEIRSMQSKLDQLIAKEKEVSKSGVEGQKQFQKELNTTGTNTDKLGNGFQKLGGYIAGAFAVSSLVAFGKEVVDVTRKTELLQNQLNFVAGSAEGGEKLFRQLQGQAKRLGLEFEGMSKGFTQFAVSSKQAGFSAQQSLEIYNKLAGGIRGSGASADAANRAFYALEQIMSKGVLSAEEIRQQMGEAIPGSVAIAAKSMNITTTEFNKLLETGQIISSEFIPAFADAVYNEFSPALAGKTNSLDASISRASNALLDFKRILGDKDFFKASASVIATEMERINVLIQNGGFGAALGLYTTNREALVNMADDMIAANDAIAAGMDKTAAEAVTQAKTISLLSAEQRKQKEQELNTIQTTLQAQKDAGTATSEQINSLNRIIQVKQELVSLDKIAEADRAKSAEQRKADEETFLRNAIALAQIKVVESGGGLETLAARQQLLDATFNLEVANEKKTEDEKKLIRAVYNKEAAKLQGEYVAMVSDATIDAAQEEAVDMNGIGMQRLNQFLDNENKKREAANKTFKEEVELELWLADIKKKNDEEERQRNISLALSLANTLGSVAAGFSQLSADRARQDADVQIQEQERLLDEKLISEEQYEKEVAAIKAVAFESQKKASAIQAAIQGALAVVNLFATLPFPAALIASPFLAALTAEQINLINSQQAPTFHDGGIDIQGNERKTSGDLKSDEFMAKLQKGETVLDREDTKMYKADLMAMRDGSYRDYVAKHYIQPAMKRAQDKPQSVDHNTNTMELAFQTAEMINVLKQNKTVRLHDQTVEKIVGGLQQGTKAKILNRRRLS